MRTFVNASCLLAISLFLFTGSLVAQLPDLTVSNVQAPSSVSGGDMVTVHWTTSNIGTGAMPGGLPILDFVYLSRSLILDTQTDLLVGVGYHPAGIAAGASESDSATISVPDSTGTFYVFIMADGTNQLVESNESNNTGHSGPMVIGTAHPDLVVNQVSAPATGSAGQNISFTYTVTNEGTAALQPSSVMDKIVLSTDTTFDDTDYVLNFNTVDTSLAVGASYTATMDGFLPASLSGYYYIIVKTNYIGIINELNTGNNTGRSSIIGIDVKRPDLLVSGMTMPSQLHTGQRVAFSYTVMNAGDTSTSGRTWSDLILLSKDTIRDDSDQFLGFFQHTANLNAGASVTVSDSVPLPPGLQNGTYRILVVLDQAGQINESNENNNLGISPPISYLFTGPDLVIRSVTIPDSVPSGTDFTVHYTVGNAGNQPSPPVSRMDGIYLSSDSIFDYEDQLIGTASDANGIAAGQDVQRTATAHIPLTGTGPCYIIVWTDITNVVSEYSEANNTGSSGVLKVIAGPGPDLRVTAVTVSDTVNSGDTMTVRWEVTNIGTGTTGGTGWYDVLTLTHDTTTGGFFVGTFISNAVLAPGQHYTNSARIRIPTASPGDWYLGVKTNAANQLIELNTANNVTFSPLIRVTGCDGPDLVVTNITFPPAARTGQAIDISWQVKNIGNRQTTVPSWEDRVRLSIDTNLSSTWTLGSFPNPTYLGPGESYSRTATVTIPQELNGPYYFVVDAGTPYRPDECSVANNTHRAQSSIQVDLTPPPDLQVASFIVPPAVFSGQILHLSYTVRNIGSGTAYGTWRDYVYLSTDTVRGAPGESFAASYRFTGAIQPESVYVGNVTVTLPQGISGRRYLIVTANADKKLFEYTFTANNTSHSDSMSVTLAPPPDLVVGQMTIASNGASGKTTPVQWTVRNQGPGVTGAGAWYDAVYVSASASFDNALAKLAGTFYHSDSLDPDSSYTVSDSITIPDGMSGQIYVYVRTDSRNNVFEYTAEDNNIGRSATAMNVTLSPSPDLQVTQVSVPPTATSGEKLACSFVVTNQSLQAATGRGWNDKLYLSSSSTWNPASAVLVADLKSLHLLGPGASYTATAIVTVPLSLYGTLYLYVFTNADSSVYEGAGEGNNITRSGPITTNAYPMADLAVDSIHAPASAAAGQPMEFSYTVSNIGTGRTLLTQWEDVAYLSIDTVLNPVSDAFLGRIDRLSPLSPGAAYSRQLSLMVPDVAPGSYYLLVKTDETGSLNDSDRSNNTGHSAVPVVIQVLPPPDLIPLSVTFPPVGNAGQPVEVIATIKNQGAGGTFQSSWYDAVYLSSDQSLDTFDLLLASYHRTSPLAAGATYAETLAVTVPYYLSGDYYIITKTDIRNDVGEGALELNNTVAMPFTIVQSPPCDLVAASVSVPVSGVPGENTTISWVTRNLGPNPVKGTLWDAVYLSQDTVWDVNDPLLGLVLQNIDLGVGGSVPARLTTRLDRKTMADSAGNITDILPGLSPGSYHVIVRTDVRNNIPETDETNNNTVSGSQMAVDVPQLPLGMTVQAKLLRGERKYYRVDTGPGLDLRINLTGDEPSVSNELYVAFGRTPTTADFEFIASESFQPNRQLMIPSTKNGSYYVLVFNRSIVASDSEHVSVRADALPFSVLNIYPPEGGKGGAVTCLIGGAGFRDSTAFTLIDQSSARITGTVLQRVSSTQAYVRFDLGNAQYGPATIEAANGGTVQTLAGAFSVAVPVVDRLVKSVYAPYSSKGLLIGRPAAYDIAVTNGNNNDYDLVLVTVMVPAEQDFSLTTNDFVGRPIPQGIPDTATLPNAGVRFNQDWAIMTVLAKNVHAGQTLKARLNMKKIVPGCAFPCGDQLPVIVDVRGLSYGEFLGFEFDFWGQVRDEILRLDPMTVPPNVLALVQNPNWQADFEKGYRDVGLLDSRPITTRTLPLIYDPAMETSRAAKLMSLVAAGSRNICNVTLNTLQSLGSLYGIVNATMALSVGAEASFLFGLIVASGPIGWVLLAASVGVFAYGFYKVHEGGDLLAASLICKRLLLSFDPNDISGPPGYGDRKWIGTGQAYDYTIRFENDPRLASAPAQLVTVTQVVDSTADVRSFRLGSFGFANLSFDVPPNTSFYTRRLDLRDSLGIYVDVNAGLDITRHSAFWTFRSIDPATGQPPLDPQKGLLPVNDTLNHGQGFVTYSIRALAGVRTGDSLRAAATIVFDANPAINTPSIANTLDAGLPHSSVSVLPAATGSTSFTVTWNAADDSAGSGLAGVSVFVSINDSTFRPWLTDVTDTAAVFRGSTGNKYAFYSLAKDNAGNTEAAKSVAEATTTVTGVRDRGTGLPKRYQLLQNYPNPFNPATTIAWDLPKTSRVSLVIYTILGQQLATLADGVQLAGHQSVTFDARRYASGVYFYRLVATDPSTSELLFTDVRKMLLIK